MHSVWLSELPFPTTVLPNERSKCPRGVAWTLRGPGADATPRSGTISAPIDTRAHSAAYISGFSPANYLSECAIQLEESDGHWSKRKSAPGYIPLGPWLVTPDEVDGTNLRFLSWVNEEPRQDSNTSGLVFFGDFITWHLSQYLALEPGEVALTATPEGVVLSGRLSHLSPRDVLEPEIEELGRQRQEFGQAWTARKSMGYDTRI